MSGDNRPTDSLQERGRKNDFLELINVGVSVKGRPLIPIRFGTAQRSQAKVHANRMIDAEFTDTLALDLIKADYDNNHRDYLWMAWSGIVRRNAKDEFDPVETRKAKEQRRREARNRQDNIDEGENVADADALRSSQGQVLTIPQDVILQLRSGANRHDRMVFQRNTITLFPPYFFVEPGFPGYNGNEPESPLNDVIYYNINFVPGTPTSQMIPVNNRRP